jgi:hypothetical protein
MAERMPAQDLLDGSAGTGGGYIQATRGRSYAFVYLPQGGAVTIKSGILSGKKMRAWWFNPRNGQAQKILEYRNRGPQTFTAPGAGGRGNDWILVLDDTSQRTPPGQVNTIP